MLASLKNIYLHCLIPTRPPATPITVLGVITDVSLLCVFYLASTCNIHAVQNHQGGSNTPLNWTNCLVFDILSKRKLSVGFEMSFLLTFFKHICCAFNATKLPP